MNNKTISFSTILILIFGTLNPLSGFAQAGDLDFTFNYDGKVTTDISSEDYANTIAIQTDGKIVVAGRSTTVLGQSDFSVVRYDSIGNLDNTFNQDGKVTTDFFSWTDGAKSIAIQPDGKIVVAGDCDSVFTFSDFAVVRYNEDGSLDNSFGVNGKVSTDFNISGDFVSALALQSDGKIVVVGTSSNVSENDNFALARYYANGNLDASFGDNGKVTTDFNSTMDIGNAVFIQADGKIVVAGNSKNATNNDFALARYNMDGSLDSSFGLNGKVTTPIGLFDDVATSVSLQNDGKIVVAGFYEPDNLYPDFAIVRYNNDGSLDYTFGSDGKVTSPTGFGSDYGYAISIQSDGKIVVAGQISVPAQPSGRFGVARYNANGSVDYSFGTEGKVTTAIGLLYDVGKALTIQTDGRIVVAGYTNNGTNNDFAVVRYLGANPNGLTVEEPQKTRLFFYPNPFTHATFMRLDRDANNTTLLISNIFGQRVKRINHIPNQIITLYRDDLPSGIYFVQITQDDKVISTDKLVIVD